MLAHNASVNLDYTINKQDVLLSTFQFNRRGGDMGSFMAYDELNASQQITDQYLRRRGSDNSNWMADGALSFKRTITPQRNEWIAEVRYNRSDDRDETRLWRESLTGAITEIETNDTDAQADQLTAQLDVTRGIGKTLKLETGYKGNLRLMDRDFVVMKDVAGSGNLVRDPASNALEFDESVNAVYAVLSGTTPKFDWQAGLRGEYASRSFTLADSGEEFPHDYTSLFPSALVNFKLNDKTQAKVSYSRRIRRPGTQELNPFPQFFDINNVFFGNPQLDPEYTDAFELGFQKSGALGTLQISPFYRRTTNIIRVDINTADTVGGREVTSINFTNLDHSDSWGADVNTQLRLSPKLSGFAAFNLFKMVTDGGTQSALSSNGVNWTVRFNANYNVTPSTTVIGNYFYRGAQKIERGEFAAVSITNLSVRQKVSQSSTITARIQDPFETMKFRVNVGDDNINQLTTRQFNNRALFLTYQWNFGQTPKMKQRRQEEQQAPQTGFGN
jgi:outer membrane receptor protein involved in Fe transport